MYFSHLFLAQEGSQAASEVIQQSLQLSQDTVEAWQRTWDAAIDPDVYELWVVRFLLVVPWLHFQ